MTDIPRTLIICVSLHPISNQQKIDMQKNLVIVESPAKAKTIEKFLGKDYKVMSSYGHIRDLKTKIQYRPRTQLCPGIRDSL